MRGDACAAIVGDITPNCGISKQKKAELEADAIRDIQKMLGADTAVGVPCTLFHTGDSSCAIPALWRRLKCFQAWICMWLLKLDPISVASDAVSDIAAHACTVNADLADS